MDEASIAVAQGQRIDINALDAFMSSVKEKILFLEGEASEPVWFGQLKDEIDAVSALARKLEQCQLDINILRDTIYCAGGDVSKNPLQDQIKFIAAEMEGLKLLIRRVDIHQSKDRLLYGQIKSLQLQMKRLKTSCDEILEGTLISSIKSEFAEDIKYIRLLVDNTVNSFLKSEQEFDAKVLKMNQSLHTITHTLEKVQTLNRRDRKDLDKVIGEAAIHDENISKLFLRQKQNDIIKGGGRTSSLFNRYNLRITTKAFATWFNYAESVKVYESNLRSEYGNMLYKTIIAMRFGQKRMQKRFDKWVEIMLFERRRDRLLNANIKPIIHYMLMRIKPDVKKYLHLWKRQTVQLRIQESTELIKELRKKPNYFPDGNYPKQLGRTLTELRGDSYGKFDVINHYIVAILDDQRDIQETSNITRRDIAILHKSIKQSKEELLVIIDQTQAGIDMSIANTRKVLDNAVQKMEGDVHDRVTEVNRRIDLNEMKLNRLNSESEKLNVRCDAINEKIDRVLLLQGTILARVEKLEERQDRGFSQLDAIDDFVKSSAHKVDVAYTTVGAMEVKLEASITHYDEKISTLSSETKEINTRIDSLLCKDEVFDRDISALRHSVDKVERRMKEAVKLDPHAKELYKLYVKFESQMLHNDSMMVGANEMSSEVATDVSDFTVRLADHIAATADRDILIQQFVRDGINQNDDKRINADAFTANTLKRRNELVNIFYDQFIALLKEKDPDPGYSKANARIVFHRRFTRALELAMGKTPSIEVGYSGTLSSITRSKVYAKDQKHNVREACVVCNSSSALGKSSNILSDLLDSKINAIVEKKRPVSATALGANRGFAKGKKAGHYDDSDIGGWSPALRGPDIVMNSVDTNATLKVSSSLDEGQWDQWKLLSTNTAAPIDDSSARSASKNSAIRLSSIPTPFDKNSMINHLRAAGVGQTLYYRGLNSMSPEVNHSRGKF